VKRKMRRVKEKSVRVMILTEEGVFRISRDFIIDMRESDENGSYFVYYFFREREREERRE
jgi:hypothetical protein